MKLAKCSLSGQLTEELSPGTSQASVGNIPGQLLHPVLEEGRNPLGLFRCQGPLVSKERWGRAKMIQVTQKVQGPQMTTQCGGGVMGL